MDLAGFSTEHSLGDAEEELARCFAPRVRLYGLRHLRDEQAADDLVQDVMLITIRKLRAGELREPEKLASFILGIARTVTLDQRRTTRRREQLLSRYGREIAPTQAFPEPSLDTRRLRSCLEGLQERERSVLVMTFYADMSGEQAARELGISPENLRVIRHRSLRKLRDCLDGRIA